jgi:microcystin degradation protein MlrC
MRRLAIARLWHEGNSFNPLPTGAADFHRREWALGPSAPAAYRGTATEMGAAVAFADAAADWEVDWLRLAAAPPGGPVDQDFLDAVTDEIVEGVARSGADAVYLSLHGALIGTRSETADLDLARRVRQAAGAAPIALSFDLHANLHPDLAEHADVIVGYKTYPHVDMDRAADTAIRLVTRAAEGAIRPVSRIVPVDAVLGSFNMRTSSGPMADAEVMAVQLAATPGVLDVTPFGGFAYADVPHAGACVAVCDDGDAGRAAAVGSVLAGFLRGRRADFKVHLPHPEEGIARALASPGTVAVLEPADNPLSGGVGDGTSLFRALIETAPDVPAVFAFFWDPDLVARAHAAGEGAVLEARLGGRLLDYAGAPVGVTARVARLTQGRFLNEGPMERGLGVDLGPTAVLEVHAGGRGIAVIVTSTCQSPNDAAYFALHGIDLAATRLLCVKAKNHFRAAFAGRLAAIVDVDTPGPAAADLARLPFRRVPRHRLG